MGARDEVGGLSVEGARQAVVAGLESRREEIEARLRSQIDSDLDANEVLDVEYAEGLRASIGKALDYALAAIVADGGPTPQVPALLMTQARLAARNAVPLTVVQRRYMDGFHLFVNLLAEEAEKHGAAGAALLKSARETTKARFDKLIDAVEEEHTREQVRPPSSAQRRVALVRERLAGKPVDCSELGYEFNSFHIGLIAGGTAAVGAIVDLANELDCLPLILRPGEDEVWAWLGRREPPDADKLQRLASSSRWPAETPLGIGEVGRGSEGWCRSHRQAGDAFRLATRVPTQIVRYGDAPLLASVIKDEGLVGWLLEIYLAPLRAGRGGGARLCEILLAYLAAGRNGASAGSALGLDRQTVSYHVKMAEEKLGCAISERAAEIELALRLEQLGAAKEHRPDTV